MAHDHGNTPAAWTGVSIVLVGFVVGGLGLVFENMLVFGLGCLLTAAAFLVAVRGAGRWPEMSRRYDAPGDGVGSDGRTGATDLWRALDEGRDPTA